MPAAGRGEEGDVRIYDLSAQPKEEKDGVAYLDGVTDPDVMVRHLLDSDDSVLCLAVSPDRKRLAAGGTDRTVRIWNVRRRVQIGANGREPRRLGARSFVCGNWRKVPAHRRSG